MKKVKVIQPAPPSEEIPTEVIASAIIKMSEAMREINNTRLSRRALVALIHDQSKVPKKTIDIVLNNLTELERDWLIPSDKPR